VHRFGIESRSRPIALHQHALHPRAQAKLWLRTRRFQTCRLQSRTGSHRGSSWCGNHCRLFARILLGEPGAPSLRVLCARVGFHNRVPLGIPKDTSGSSPPYSRSPLSEILSPHFADFPRKPIHPPARVLAKDRLQWNYAGFIKTRPIHPFLLNGMTPLPGACRVTG
jgi:hypothetical protein